MSSFTPPVISGKFPSGALRLLVAALVMFVLDLPLLAAFFTAMPFIFLIQYLVLLGILLLTANRRVAVLLLLVVSTAYFARFGQMGCPPSMAWVPPVCLLGPLWIGTFIALRPCKTSSPDTP